MKAKIARIVLVMGALATTTLTTAQQSQKTISTSGGGTPSATSASKPRQAKTAAPQPKLALTAGLWSGPAVFKSGDDSPSGDKDQVFSFSIENGTLTGEGTFPVNHFCKDGFKMSASLTVDFSERMKYSGPNSFGTLPVERIGPLKTANIVAVVKGTFLSASSASGSVSVTGSDCKPPTVYTWTATPQASGGQ